MNTRTQLRAKLIVAAIALTIAAATPVVASAVPKGKAYATPEKAVEAFVAALRNYNPKTLTAIFGKGSESLFDSGDPVADEKLRAQFLEMYDAKQTLAPKGDAARILVVGKDDWPLPIPIVRTGSKWAFDTAAGEDEIVNRRIGRNELFAIQTCLAIGDAQREYFSRDRDGDGILEFAQKIPSTVGLRDGLFWRVEEGEAPSPLGELLATAAEEGYSTASDNYHGYHYKWLRGQGPSAAGGAYEYVVRDNQIGGFAIVAWPAYYGDTGIMTFVMNHDGVVFQRDLGEATEDAVKAITLFDPGQGWTRVDDKDLVPLPEN